METKENEQNRALEELEDKLPTLADILALDEDTVPLTFYDIFPPVTDFDREVFIPTHRGKEMKGQVLADWWIRRKNARDKRTAHRQSSRMNRRVKRLARV